jgi:hypothetical protein
MWFRRSKILDRFHRLASHQAKSSLNNTRPFIRPLIKARKSLERGYFSAIQTSINLSSFIFTLMHQIISWGQSSCRIKSLYIAFYSRKLKTAQKHCTTTERELLSAIETCKEYKNILLDYPL